VKIPDAAKALSRKLTSGSPDLAEGPLVDTILARGSASECLQGVCTHPSVATFAHPQKVEPKLEQIVGLNPGTNGSGREKTSIKSMVGVTGFEPATPTSRT
jgi:hypothetical protein